MGTGFAKKKKQAKMMQEQLSQIQNKLQTVEVIGTAGNGLVTITLNGDHEMKRISIKPECIDPEDADGLQDLIRAAYQDANKKLQEASSIGNLGIPGGMPDFGSLGL